MKQLTKSISLFVSAGLPGSIPSHPIPSHHHPNVDLIRSDRCSPDTHTHTRPLAHTHPTSRVPLDSRIPLPRFINHHDRTGQAGPFCGLRSRKLCRISRSHSAPAPGSRDSGPRGRLFWKALKTTVRFPLPARRSRLPTTKTFGIAHRRDPSREGFPADPALSGTKSRAVFGSR